MNSFPNILLQRAITNCILRTDSPSIKTLTDALVVLRSTYNQGVKATMYEPFVFIRGASWSKPNQEIFELLSKNRVFQHYAKWIYKNIILCINTDCPQTIDVKMRIALCMLIDINLNISKDLYIYICNCVIDNIEELSETLMDEELPF